MTILAAPPPSTPDRRQTWRSHTPDRRHLIGRRLNKLSTYDSRWIAITQTMGSNSRQEIAKRLAHRYVQSAALKRVVKDIVGPDKDLNTLGEAELMENVASGYRDAQGPMISSIAQQQGAVLEEE